jgi:hypothetical protein
MACLVSGTTLAATSTVQLTNYIVIQPIDVCDNNGSNCAPINNLGQTASSNPLPTQIGFIDSNTNENITRNVLNQAGIDVTFNPVVKYSSTTYQVLDDIAGCTAQGSQPNCLTSPKFQLMTSGTATPKPPLSSNPTTINMFFVNGAKPGTNDPPTGLYPSTPPGGYLYGFGWVNGNGVAIGVNTFAPRPSQAGNVGLSPRPDTIVHEIMHTLGPNHTTNGAGPNPPATNVCDAACINNVVTQGSLRNEPDAGTNNRGQALWVGEVPIYGTANSTCSDNSGTTGICDLINTPTKLPSWFTGTSQQTAALASGFMNPIQNQTTTASKSTKTTVLTKRTKTAALTRAARPSTCDNLGPPCKVTFTVTYQPDVITVNGVSKPVASGRPGEYLSQMVFTLPDNLGLKFKDRTFEGPGGSKAQVVNGELIVTLNPRQFPPSDTKTATLQFTQGITTTTGSCNFNTIALTGMHLQYVFSSGWSPTGTFAVNSFAPGLTASSRYPDSDIEAVLFNPNSFVGASSFACTPVLTNSGLACPDYTLIGLPDADPLTEGGQTPPD